MTVEQVQELFKNMSAQELATVQNMALTSPEFDDDQRAFCIALVGNELAIRQNESLGRKAERFWNRHGDGVAVKAALVGIGALLGVQLG